MLKFSITSELNCSQDKFHTLFFDESFIAKMYLEGLHYKKFTILEQSETDTELFRKLAITPTWKVPHIALSAIGGFNAHFIEEGKFDKTTKIWSWKWILSREPKRFILEGTLEINPLQAAKIQYTHKIQIVALLLIVGETIEKSLEKFLQEEIAKSLEVFKEQIVKDLL